MNRANQKNKKPFGRPYIFILKEGKEIKKNSLDYSLMLLQTGQAEFIGYEEEGQPKLFISN